jgi:hypothetical protein
MSEQLLEKFAETIVGRFFNEKVALNDGVTEVAQSENLNDEQVKRLVEAVNTTAFLKKFNNPSPGADGRVVEFETANPDAVINRMLSTARDTMDRSASPCTEDGNDLTQDLPVTRNDKAPLEPVKEAEYSAPEPRIKKHVVDARLRKTAELLKEQEYQARNNFTDTTQALLNRFRRASGASFEAFEKDAFYQLGPAAAPHLQLLRRSLGRESADYDHVDMHKYARVVDMATPEMRLFQQMLKTSQTLKECRKGQEKVGEYLGRIA